MKLSSKFNVITALIISWLVYLIVLYIKPEIVFTSPPDAQWWSALSILVALSFAILAMNYFKSNEVYELKKQIGDNQKKLRSVIDMISVLTDMHNFSENKSRNDWDNVLLKIENLNELNLIKSRDLRIWSSLAWRKDYLDICQEIREKAYEIDKNDLWNSTYLASILSINGGDEHRILSLVNDIDKTNNYKEFAMAQAVLGRMYAKKGDFSNSEKCYKSSVSINRAHWHFKGLVFALICNGKIDLLKKTIGEWEGDPNSVWNKNNTPEREIFRTFSKLFYNSTLFDDFYKYFSITRIHKITQQYIDAYSKFNCFNLYENLKKLDYDNEILNAYLTYYIYLGTDDAMAEKALENDIRFSKISTMIKSR